MRATHPVLWMLVPLLALGSVGCQTSRTWFQLDSNSRMPFFGVDLTPRFSQTDAEHEATGRLVSDEGTSPTIRPASEVSMSSESPTQLIRPFQPVPKTDSARTKSRDRFQIRLPRAKDLFKSEEELPVSFTGPETTFR